MVGNHPEAVLNVNIVQNEGGKLLEIKLKGFLPGLGPKLMFPVFIGGIVFYILFMGYLFESFSVPLIFRIGVPVMIIIVFLVLLLGLYETKKIAVHLSRQGNQLFIRRVLPLKSNEETITLNNDSKFVLVKFLPLQTFGRYQLLLNNGDDLNIIVPKLKWYKLLKNYPIITPGTTMRKFLYVPENARKISKLLEIPLEESTKSLHEYVNEFKKKWNRNNNY